MSTAMRLADWCVAHRRRVLIAWLLLLLVAALAAYSGIGTRAANQFSLSGTESQRAQDLLEQSFPAQSGDVDQVVFRARQGRITDPAIRARIEQALTRVSRLPHVSGVTGPYAAGTAQISKDGRIAFATVAFNEKAPALSRATVERVISTATPSELRRGRRSRDADVPGHGGTRGRVRGVHGHLRAAGHVRARSELPQRAGRGVGHRRPVHDAGRCDGAARAPVARRRADRSRPRRAVATPRLRRVRHRILAPLGAPDPPPSVAPRRSPGWQSCSSSRYPRCRCGWP
jgi:hypothetical protein